MTSPCSSAELLDNNKKNNDNNYHHCNNFWGTYFIAIIVVALVVVDVRVFCFGIEDKGGVLLKLSVGHRRNLEFGRRRDPLRTATNTLNDFAPLTDAKPTRSVTKTVMVFFFKDIDLFFRK